MVEVIQHKKLVCLTVSMIGCCFSYFLSVELVCAPGIVLKTSDACCLNSQSDRSQVEVLLYQERTCWYRISSGNTLLKSVNICIEINRITDQGRNL